MPINRPTRHGLLLLALLLPLVAVSQLIFEDGFEDDPTGPVNSPPVAEAGTDRIVNAGDRVVLDGSGSRDADDDTLSYRWIFEQVGLNTDFIPALPTALMKPLSGSGARGMMVDAMNIHGADSFVGRVASTVQGATDTTFYVLAVYFGSVGIKNTRYAVVCGLIADFTGIIAAILMAYLFFH